VHRHSRSVRVAASRLLHTPPFNQLSDRVARLVGAPRIDQLGARVLTDDPVAAARAVLGEDPASAEEYRELSLAIGGPPEWVVGDNTARLLYTLVRHLKPALVVEVGVATGRSTQVMLAALDANDHGRLVSADIDAGVGGDARGHPRWELRVHNPRKSARQLDELLAEVGPPDLFLHDGSHAYYDQLAEYLIAFEHMRPDSVFVSDDVDWSFAFYDFTRDVGVESVVLLEQRKAAGLFRRP
jgi:predicted O-methyltransferase YrrM